MNIIGHRRLFLSIAGLLTAASFIFIFIFGLPYGIDFKGGSLFEVKYTGGAPVAAPQIKEILKSFEVTGIQVQAAEDGGFLLRSSTLSENQHQDLANRLKDLGGENSAFEEVRFESVGPSVGAELKSKAWMASILAIIFIIIYIAWAFRKVSKPVRSWQYGIISIIALIHDVIIPLGVFAILGKYIGYEIDTAFIAAVLTILGYSINDTIIIFDRIRENLLRRQGDEFETVVNDSVNETITRSINTTLTTLLVLFALFFFGGATIKGFVLVLIIGIASGAYSSIFIASPLLVVLERRLKRR